MSCGIDTGSQACEGLQPPLGGSRVKRPDYRAIDPLPGTAIHDPSSVSASRDEAGSRFVSLTAARSARRSACHRHPRWTWSAAGGLLPDGFVLPGRRFFAVIDRRGGSAGSARWDPRSAVPTTRTSARRLAEGHNAGRRWKAIGWRDGWRDRLGFLSQASWPGRRTVRRGTPHSQSEGSGSSPEGPPPKPTGRSVTSALYLNDADEPAAEE
jgi:hypothetical protein